MASNLPFYVFIVIVAAMLIATLVAGIQNWQTIGGKITAIAAGFLLVVFAAFVALVAIIVISGHAGHPF